MYIDWAELLHQLRFAGCTCLSDRDRGGSLVPPLPSLTAMHIPRRHSETRLRVVLGLFFLYGSPYGVVAPHAFAPDTEQVWAMCFEECTIRVDTTPCTKENLSC